MTRKLPHHLVILMAGRVVGRVERGGSKLQFVYDDAWRHSDPGIPLSLSMPLTEAVHRDDRITPWMWGLLPDNDRTLQRIGNEHDVSPRNPFGLLWAIGQDCPGAVQFAEEARIDEVTRAGDVKWLDEAEIAARLASLRREASIGRRANEGQFCLPGAQPKTAFCLIDGKWGVPSGRTPTTHIFKPPSTDLQGHLQNEHFCLRLAGKLGLVAAKSQVLKFGDEIAIVVERYDRRQISGRILRAHQEDICQAMGVHPERKYEFEGGPGIKAIMDILHTSTDPVTDRRRFMEAVAFNFLIGGTDAHGKNISVLLGRNQVRLAPLYDVASFLPYAERWQNVKMPMKIDKYYLYADIQPHHWERLAKSVGFPADELLETLERMARAIPAAAQEVATAVRADGADHPVLDRLVGRIGDWAEETRKATRRGEFP